MQYYESFMLFLTQTNAQSARACIYNIRAIEILVYSEVFLIQIEEISTELGRWNREPFFKAANI